MATTTSSTPRTLTLVGVLLLIVGFAALFGYTIPMHQQAREENALAKATLDTRTQELESILKARTELQAAKQTLTQAGVNLSRLDQVVPVTEDMPTVYYQLQDYQRFVGGLAGYDFQVGQPVVAPSGAAEVPVTIVVTGSYPEIKRFVGQIQTSERPFVVSTLNLVLADAGYRASLVGSFFGGQLSPSFSTATK
jgi:Tfp pilus assembly protein PilO